jgi:hypothetical protein
MDLTLHDNDCSEKDRQPGSSGKRQHHDEASSGMMDVDDLVSMISSKLENLDTSDSFESLVAVIVEVLKCTSEEAAFFLDSVSVA